MKKALLLLFALVVSKSEFAQVTWAEHIAPIFYTNCTSCHHKGGMAPFSLTTYAGAYQHAEEIDSNVVSRTMPPWPADPHFSRLAHERILSQSDINKIHQWLQAGAPTGDSANAPAPPVYTNGSALGTPDLTLRIPTFTVPSNQLSDLYQCFALPSGLSVDQFITAMEIVPGNSAIVHHVLVYIDTTGEAATLDANSPGPGYTQFGGIGVSGAILLGGWVPGSLPYFLPENMGAPVYKNATIVLQIHYPAGSKNKSDSTTINLKLANNVTRKVGFESFLYHFAPSLQNGPLEILADSVKTFAEKFKIPLGYDATLLTVGPHAHLLAKQWTCFAITKEGDTIPFIKINNWDFKWQGFYPFRSLIKVPSQSTLWAYCTYDNTANNPNNPNKPPKKVTLGEATTNEMMLVYFSYTLYKTGDENIVIDSSELVDITDTTLISGITDPKDMIVSSPQLYDASPNPANNETMFSYYLTSSAPAEINIYDLKGALLETVKANNTVGFNNIKYSTANLSAGTYVYTLTTGSTVRSKQLIITK